MVATLTTVDALLKEIYGPRVEDQLQSEAVGLKRIEKSSEGVTTTKTGGKYVDFPIRVKRNHGTGYRNENEQLPAAKAQGYAEVHVPLKYGYGRVRLTGQVMELAEKDYQSFASTLDEEMDGLKETLAKDSNRIFYKDGSGLLASINDTATSATHAVDSALFLEIGMQVDVLVRSSGATVQLDTEITDIDGLNVTFADSFTGATTQGVYREGSRNKEPSGLETIISATTTLHGVAPGTQRTWKATINGNSGTNRALSEGLMIKQVDDQRVQGGKVSLILTSLGVRRAYFNLLTQQRRFTGTKEFAGGFTGLVFNHGREIPVVEDVDHPPNEMDFLDEKHFKIYQSEDWHWARADGTTLKWVHDYDAWEAMMRKYWEIGVARRNAQGRLEDITEG